MAISRCVELHPAKGAQCIKSKDHKDPLHQVLVNFHGDAVKATAIERIPLEWYAVDNAPVDSFGEGVK